LAGFIEAELFVQEPQDLFYGQRRTLLKDSNGMLVDASAPVANVSDKNERDRCSKGQ